MMRRARNFRVPLQILFALFLIATPALATSKYPIVVRGGDEASFSPKPTGPLVNDSNQYDAIIVGSGLAGLSAAVYLTDQNKHVLILEKESSIGGLAFGGVSNGIRYDRGASYWTDAFEEEEKILQHIGLADFRKKYIINEPIDSYLWNGKLYLGIWEKETLEKLPASFELFKHETILEGNEDLIPNQPLEEAPNMELDNYSAAQWINQMPARISRRTDPESVTIYKRFLQDTKIKKSRPMQDVIDLLDLYCRSALGATADKVSAMAFANFYLAELEPRYTSSTGTGRAAELMRDLLKKKKKWVDLATSSPATSIVNYHNHAEVTYTRAGETHVAKAKYVIYAAQLKFASQLIRDFATREPEQARLMSDLAYAHYSVHVVFTKGHPYRATYDTWTRNSNSSPEDFTDVILGRWMDPAINGYEGMRDFSKNPADDQGIMTIYNPLDLKWIGSGYTDQQASSLARYSVDQMLQLYSPMLQKNWGTQIDVTGVETSRWPFSVHLAVPGHFIHKAKILRRPFGRVFFANNNMGTPAFEEALFRGHCAANNVLAHLQQRFHQEKWSRCPLER